MRVLLVTGSLPPMRCGVGDYSWELARALVREGCDVGILTSIAGAPADMPDGIDLFAVMPGWGLSNIGALDGVLRRWRPDVVHVQYPTAGYDAATLPSLIPLIAARRGIRSFATFHEPTGWTGVCDPAAALRFLLHAFGPGRLVTTRAAFRAMLHPLWRRLSAGVRMDHIPIASNIGRSSLTAEQRRSLRSSHVGDRRRLIAYFGFVMPNKGIEDLLSIIDPEEDRLLLVAELDEADAYHRQLKGQIDRLGEAVTVTGFLPAGDVADLLAAADAVVLPFRAGASDTNGSVLAAAMQGTYVLTTSPDDRAFYDPDANIEWVGRRDPDALRSALRSHSGLKRAGSHGDDAGGDWRAIARAHIALYEGAVRR